MQSYIQSYNYTIIQSYNQHSNLSFHLHQDSSLSKVPVSYNDAHAHPPLYSTFFSHFPFVFCPYSQVVGHSYICYAPLLHGCQTILYEGKPVGTPDAGAFWRIVKDYKVRHMCMSLRLSNQLNSTQLNSHGRKRET